MQKYKVLIVDDEPLAREGIRLRLKPYSDFTILDECEDAVTALKAIRNEAPDLIFLDIQLQGMDGFEMLRRLPKNCHPQVIFLTAYDQYALTAFEVHALDYLLKPVDPKRFANAIKRARSYLKLANTSSIEDRLRDLLAEHEGSGKGTPYLERFAVRTGRRITYVFAAEIDWLEAVGDYVGLHVGKNRPLIRATLDDLEGRLDPRQFVRIHRSSIVQLSRVRGLQRLPNRDMRLCLVDGTNLRVSRTYRERLDQWLSHSQ